MAPVVNLIIAVATVFLAQNITAVKIVEGIHSTLSDSKRYFEDKYDVSDGRVTYAACRDLLPLNNTKECVFTAEKTFNQSDIYSCNVTLQTSHKETPKHLQWSIKRFGEDKIIVILKELLLVNNVLAIVKLSDCGISYVELDNEDYLRNDRIIAYQDTFDIFYENSEICGKDLCRMTIDGNGKIIKSPIGFIKKPNTILALNSISENSSDQGFILVNASNQVMMRTLIKPDGSQKLLTELDLKCYQESKTAVSTNYNYITVCSILKSYNGTGGIEGVKGYMSINCTQYDKSGSIIFETLTTKSIEDYELQEILFIHNLQEGGFIIGYTIVHASLLVRHQYLTKINSMGNDIGIGIAEAVPNNRWHSLFENDSDELCVLKEPAGSDGESALELNRKKFKHVCYNENDFQPGGFVSFDMKIGSYPLIFKFRPVVNSSTDKLNHSP